jgi:hypothetical protein
MELLFALPNVRLAFSAFNVGWNFSDQGVSCLWVINPDIWRPNLDSFVCMIKLTHNAMCSLQLRKALEWTDRAR